MQHTDNMTVLTVNYSRTGNTRRLAREISGNFKGDLEDLEDLKDRSGFLGYLRSGWDSFRGKETEIGSIKYDPSDYQLVVLGFPIWAGSIPPAIRTYLRKEGDNIDSLASFCTMKGSDPDKAYSEINNILDTDFIYTLSVKEKNLENDSYKEDLNIFLDNIKDFIS